MDNRITPFTAVLIAVLVIVSAQLFVQHLELRRMRNALIEVTLRQLEEEYQSAQDAEARYLIALRRETDEIMRGLGTLQGLNDDQRVLILRGEALVDRIDWLTATVGSGSMEWPGRER